ncbi:MAG: segregation/condensation protein A [Deltaproteobacteria bacterium]|nr:segregation/condensation protein A [Deltaproteobacteria bacterium]MDL1959858.1 segregation/condensation protein A [Deltaproteobacteria bacterium]MDL1962059.1 segregation/condensation protein A [Deltaproteobacteria bacterium]
MEPECQVKLEAFEGPLDLLLRLIQKNKIEITDIPIAVVTAQYLEYLEFMQAALDVVVAGEYLVMAATLMHIKSRMLLPRPDPADPEDDPRLELVRPLQELVQIREAAASLGGRPILGKDVFIREGGLENEELGSNVEISEHGFEDTLDVSLTDLISAFKKVLGNSSLPRVLEITRAKASLSERMESIAEELNQIGSIRFFELFSSEDREMIVVTFLAILELARLGKVRLLQESPGGDILVLLRHGDG